MTDRELLELAAKAAGYSAFRFEDAEWLELRYGYKEALYIEELGGYWNPLTDDGDALRLAVMLGLDVQIRRPDAEVWVCPPADDMELVRECFGADEYAATRRAIVRAAAAIGRAMP